SRVSSGQASPDRVAHFRTENREIARMKPKMRTLGQIAAFGAFALSSAVAAAATAVPATIAEEGRLFDAAGAPVSGSITFSFSASPDTSTTTALWTETKVLTVDGGYFSTLLGDTTPFPATLFTGATRYLGIKEGSDSEMTPRHALVSVPYAQVAANAI